MRYRKIVSTVGTVPASMHILRIGSLAVSWKITVWWISCGEIGPPRWTGKLVIRFSSLCATSERSIPVPALAISNKSTCRMHAMLQQRMKSFQRILYHVNIPSHSKLTSREFYVCLGAPKSQLHKLSWWNCDEIVNLLAALRPCDFPKQRVTQTSSCQHVSTVDLNHKKEELNQIICLQVKGQNAASYCNSYCVTHCVFLHRSKNVPGHSSEIIWQITNR